MKSNVFSSIRRRGSMFAATAMMLTAMSALPIVSVLAATNPTPSAKVSFTFDDGFRSTYTQAMPAMQKYGIPGTVYVTTGCVGMTTVPNTCRANSDKPYMTWTQVRALQNTYKWEIGSHTKTHPLLASSDAGMDQPNKLTDAQVTAELRDSKSAFTRQGINTKAFASPYGDYDTRTLAQIAKYYESHRGFADRGQNTWPTNEYLLYNFPVQAGVTVAQVKAQIDLAIANNQWLVLTFHDINTNPSTNPADYEYRTADLAQIAAYVKSKQDAGQIRNTTVSNGVTSDTQNMLANPSFNSGMASWTTDTTAVTLNTGNNGSYPSSTNSVAFNVASGTSHLYSSRVAVNHSTTYMLKSFLNLKTATSGGVGYYIDEYDANGNWVSGQYKKFESSVFVENLNFAYKPSSANVNTANLQVIFSGTNVSGYVDNFQWFTLNSATTPPSMMPSGTFDQGITGGWRTDNTAAITADNLNNGSPSNPVNSVKLTSDATRESHLFSPNVAVSPGTTYTLANYLDIRTLGTAGEIAFYIDEYDANGNWVSGQYKFGTITLGARNVAFNYTPSSANVSSASLQVIVTKTSGTVAYFDDSRWYVAN